MLSYRISKRISYRISLGNSLDNLSYWKSYYPISPIGFHSGFPTGLQDFLEKVGNSNEIHLFKSYSIPLRNALVQILKHFLPRVPGSTPTVGTFTGHIFFETDSYPAASTRRGSVMRDLGAGGSCPPFLNIVTPRQVLGFKRGVIGIGLSQQEKSLRARLPCESFLLIAFSRFKARKPFFSAIFLNCWWAASGLLVLREALSRETFAI